jgi:hypothetical protein
VSRKKAQWKPEAWPIDFEYEVDGVPVKLSLTYEGARKIHEDWSESIALLNLGSEAPLLKAGLAKVFKK